MRGTRQRRVTTAASSAADRKTLAAAAALARHTRHRPRGVGGSQRAGRGNAHTCREGECAHVPSGPGRAQPAQQLSLLAGTAATRRRARGSGPSGQVQQGPWGKKREERRPHHQRVRRARGGSRDDGQVARSHTAISTRRPDQAAQPHISSATFDPPPRRYVAGCEPLQTIPRKKDSRKGWTIQESTQYEMSSSSTIVEPKSLIH